VVADETGGASASPLIEVRHVSKEFPFGQQRVRALADISMTVDEGSFVVVMGPSGSGKSTLLNLIGGLDRPTSGQIVVAGQDVSGMDEISLAQYRRKWIGFVFQSFNLIGTMTARQNVEFPMVFSGRPRAERHRRADELLESVGLGHRLGHRPMELSGGEQQRVAIARAMANHPRIVVGDEPTGNLDTRTGLEVLHILSRLNEAGRTVLVVTHDTRLADFAHRVIRMQDGRVLREEPGGHYVPTELPS
jgi:ABC-type lipoprotein export system ATPase subunit